MSLISNGIVLYTSDGMTSPYGACFSPDGSKVYVSYAMAGPEWTRLSQYDLSSNDSTGIRASEYALTHLNNNITSRFGAIEIGPNGKLYVTHPHDLIGVIKESGARAILFSPFRMRSEMTRLATLHETKSFTLPTEPVAFARILSS